MRKEVASESAAQLERCLRDALARESTVRWAYLFGSAARGEPNQRALDIEPWLAEFERIRNEALRRRRANGGRS